jgi:cholest-4-en-3-one 26-monooxygenase
MQTRNQRAPTNLAEVDVLDPDVWVKGVPHEAFKLLRREAPIYYHPEPAGRGFWTITKYDDLVTVSMDSATFSSYRGGTNIPDLPEEAMNIIRMLLINMDPPKHTRYRRLVSKGFTPKVVREMEPHVRQITRQIIDNVCAKGECDFVTEIAAELPLQVILEMMGVPMEDRHMIFDWSNRLIGSEDGEYATAPDQARFAGMEMFQYANGLASDRAKCPMDDIATTLIHAEVAGERLSQPEFDAFFMLLSVAGNETTRNLISGAMRAFFEHPEQWRRLKADPSLMPTAVEEMLRWVSPVSYFRRTATRDVVIRGHEIPEGDKVVMYYCSANRDEEVFPDGDVFDIGRNPNEHVTFGPGGAHFCLGAKLARLEIEVMFQELLRRLPDLEQAGPAQRLRSNFINGTKHLPVRFTPSKAKGA